QRLPRPGRGLGAEGGELLAGQPAAATMVRMGAERRGAAVWPGVDEITAQPELRLEIVLTQVGQRQLAVTAAGERQLMPGQVVELAVQPVLGARPEPLRRVAAVAGARAEIELYRQLHVAHPLAIAQQQVPSAQGASAQADRQVAGQKLPARRGPQGELPEAFVVESQAPPAALRQPLAKRRGLLVEPAQPVGQPARLGGPAAAGQRVALWP